MRYLHTMDGYQVVELIRMENDTEDNYETENQDDVQGYSI